MKKGLIILGLLFLIFPLASAIDTNITLYTKPLVDVRILVLDSGSTYYLLQSYPAYHTGFDGKMNVLFSGDKSELGFFVIIKDEGKSVFSGRLDNQPAGGQINLYVLVNETDVIETVSDVSQEESLEELNTSINNTNYTINDSLISPEVNISNSSKKSFLTGLSISPIKDVFTKNKNYLLGGIVFILLVFLAMIIVLKRGKINFGKSESYSDNRPPTILYDKKIEDAERRIKQAQKEIQDLRNSRNKSSEVSEARRKYEEAKSNLDRLEKTSSSFNRDIKPSFQQDSNKSQSNNTNNSQPGNSNKPDVKDFDFGNNK